MTARPRVLGAALPRVVAEVGLTVLALSLLPTLTFGDFDAEGRWPALVLGQVYVGLAGAILGALRLRPGGGDRRRRLGRELAGAASVPLAIWAGAVLAQVGGATWLAASGAVAPIEALMLAASGAVLGGLSAGAAAVVFAAVRGAALAWPAWDRLRRTRLLWALTHAQLLAALALAGCVAAVLVAVDLQASAHRPPVGQEANFGAAGAAAPALAWATTRLLPTATALLVLSVAAGAALLPPAALISFLVLRRATHRLENLAAATEALRAGHLSTRASVEGEDEVARLQAAFNAMAADLERTLRELEAERDRVAGLLEARRQLVATVSHELRTPVATVHGYLEAALRRGEVLPSDLRADLETIGWEVARLERLIDDLFTLARAEVGRLELRLGPTDAGAVVRRLVDTVAPLAWRQRRVEVLAEIAPDVPPARADAQRLEQTVSNLLGNAVRHTPPGGLVVAAVAAETDAVWIVVRDTGEGIAPEDLPRVFERFYRARGGDGHAGAGLGLALTRELAEAMGGSVEAASTPGEGSRFAVRLPRA